MVIMLMTIFTSVAVAQTRITSIEELSNIDLAGDYMLTKDLDFAEDDSYDDTANKASYTPTGGNRETATNAGWVPIGDGTTNFTGTFDGGGFTISNLYINTTADNVGLFGYLGTDSEVQNLGLVNAYVKGTGDNIGGLVGRNSSGTIRNCYATGNVTGTANRIGGLVGSSSGTISNSYATGNVTGTGTVTGTANRIGGLVGENRGGTIRNSYATGTVMGANDVGGLVGWQRSSSINNCFWDTGTSGLTTSAGGTGKMTTEMQMLTAGAFETTSNPNGSGWSTNNWDFGTTSQYPALRSYEKEGSNPQTQGEIICRQPAPRAGAGCPLVPNAAGIIEISTIGDLNRVRYTLDGDYVLMNDLDFANGPIAYRPQSTSNAMMVGPAATATNAGFTPIGNNTKRFTGTFDGGGFTISSLYINISTKNNVGLFRVTGADSEVQNLGLVNAYVKGANNTGGLVGQNNNTVTNCFVSGTVSGARGTGGLVGQNNNTVTNGSASGNVTGDNNTGGLVGSNNKTIQNCYATATVSDISSGSSMGGLVGNNNKTISNCYATGAVEGNNNVGGLVGQDQGGTISNCYATGTVTGGSNTGGLTGEVSLGIVIINSFFKDDTSDANTGARTESDLKMLTDAAADMPNGSGWSTNNWEFGDGTKFPTLRSYAAGGGNQVQGFVFCNQPADYVSCDDATTLRSRSIDFGAVATATTHQLVITGRKLSGAVTLTAVAPFSFEGSLTTTVTPINDGSISVRIPITLTPTANYQDLTTNTITISGGGLTAPVTVAVTGIAIPLLADTDGDGLLEISTIEQLNAVRDDLDGGYELVNNLDFTETSSYASRVVNLAYRPLNKADPTDAPVAVQTDAVDGMNPGFTPIGTFADQFTGTFEGNGFTISKLYINTSRDRVGLFGTADTGNEMRNLGLLEAYVTGDNNTGGLVGSNTGSAIQNCYVTGAVSGTGDNIGGLVGYNNGGPIQNCYATGNVTGTSDVGGLVGYNNGGPIQNCYATGNVTGTSDVGGLVGYNSSLIRNSYATGTISGTGANGLVGNNAGTIRNCFFKAVASNANTNPGARTESDLQALDVERTSTTPSERWSTDNWDFSTGKFPTLRSYAANKDNQIQGFVICNQSADHVPCDGVTALRGTPISFGVVSSTVTRQLVISGRNLSSAVTLPALTAPLAYEGRTAGQILTLTPNSNGSINASIPITLTPTADYQDLTTNTITTSGGGLSPNVEIAITGIAIPPLAEVNGSLGIQYIEQLNLVHEDLDGDYKLTRNLDFTSDDSYASGAVNLSYRPQKMDGTAATEDVDIAAATNPGFTPIGDGTTGFTGTFDGGGFTISNLYINRTSADNTALFGVTGADSKVQNLGLLEAYVKGRTLVGGLVGDNSSTITNCYATGTVTGSGQRIGGLVGDNSSTITNCYATATVEGSGAQRLGGLVGDNNMGTITNCYATGAVEGNNNVGGLVGDNGGSITNCYATGTIDGNNNAGGTRGR